VRAVPATGAGAGPNAASGPPKTPYNRWVGWSRMGILARRLVELAAEGARTGTVMRDAEAGRRHRFERPAEGSCRPTAARRG
jgi:hypothetical protein